MIKSAVSIGFLEIISTHSFADVFCNSFTKQKSLHAGINFKKNEVIASFSAKEIAAAPNYLTLQIGTHQHIQLQPEFLQYTNHSCNPSVFFDTTKMEVIALKDIESGEELSFFYPSTEWEMAKPFDCSCKQKNCLQHIDGAKNLDKEILQSYRLTDFIKEKLTGK